MRTYFVYLLTNPNHTVLYIARRVAEHKAGTHQGFTKKYNVHKLMCFETFSDVNDAIAREKQLKPDSRAKKLALINEHNLSWEELAV